MKINTVKAFKSFKSLNKMMKAVSATQTAAAVIKEIAAQDHFYSCVGCGFLHVNEAIVHTHVSIEHKLHGS